MLTPSIARLCVTGVRVTRAGSSCPRSWKYTLRGPKPSRGWESSAWTGASRPEQFEADLVAIKPNTRDHSQGTANSLIILKRDHYARHRLVRLGELLLDEAHVAEHLADNRIAGASPLQLHHEGALLVLAHAAHDTREASFVWRDKGDGAPLRRLESSAWRGLRYFPHAARSGSRLSPSCSVLMLSGRGQVQNESNEPLLLKIFVCVTVTSAGPTQAATLLDPTV